MLRLLPVAVIILVCLASCQTESYHPLTLEAHERLGATEGGQLLMQVLDAHGGLDAWHAAATSSYIWEMSSPGFLLRSRITADNRTRHIYHDILAMGTGSDPVDVSGRMAWNGTDAWISPDSLSLNPRFWAETGYYFQSIPFVLADPGINYELLPDEDLDGVSHPMLKCTFGDGVGDAPGDHYSLYVHPETNTISGIRYRSTFGRGRPSPDEPVRENLIMYTDYVTVDGLVVPSRFTWHSFSDGVKGEPSGTQALATEISFSAPFDSTQLIMPEGGRVQPMPPVSP